MGQRWLTWCGWRGAVGCLVWLLAAGGVGGGGAQQSAACLATLAKSADFQRSQSEAAANEQTVARLRREGKQDEIAAASTTWIESKNKLEALRQQALNADGRVAGAQAQLTAAKA